MKPTALMRARRLYPTSKGFRNAYVRGAKASREGRSARECPYKRGSSTWREAWRLAWLRGWYSEQSEEEDNQ